MESRLRVYVGREKMLRELAEYVAGDSTTACLVTGAAGSGKTAALARLVQLVQSATLDRTIARPVVVAHFIGASSTSSSLRQLLRRLCLVLTAEFGLDEDVPTGSDGLSAHFQGLLARIPADRRTVLVLDALDRLDETSDAQSVSWLPEKLPAHVKIIASCTDNGGDSERILLAFASRPAHRMPVPPLEDDERRRILRAVPSLWAKTLDDVQVDLLLANPATANPLFLLVALEELRGFGSFEELDWRIATFPRPVAQPSRMSNWFARARQAADAASERPKRQRQLQRLERIESALATVRPSEDPVAGVFRQVIDRLESSCDARLTGKVLSFLASPRKA